VRVRDDLRPALKIRLEASAITAFTSAFSLATKSVPMLPLAPGLFSTTPGWPHFSASGGPMTGARMSMPVPGENGTTSVAPVQKS